MTMIDTLAVSLLNTTSQNFFNRLMALAFRTIKAIKFAKYPLVKTK